MLKTKTATAAIALAGSALLVFAGASTAIGSPAKGGPQTEGHYDVVLELESCTAVGDGTWTPTEWDIVLEDHENGTILNPEEYLVFEQSGAPVLGFAVEYEDSEGCTASDGTLQPGVNEFVFDFAAEGACRSRSARRL